MSHFCASLLYNCLHVQEVSFSDMAIGGVEWSLTRLVCQNISIAAGWKSFQMFVKSASVFSASFSKMERRLVLLFGRQLMGETIARGFFQFNQT